MNDQLSTQTLEAVYMGSDPDKQTPEPSQWLYLLVGETKYSVYPTETALETIRSEWMEAGTKVFAEIRGTDLISIVKI